MKRREHAAFTSTKVLNYQDSVNTNNHIKQWSVSNKLGVGVEGMCEYSC